MTYRIRSFLATVLLMPVNAFGTDICPNGEVLRSKITVTKPSRIADLYELPKDVDADGNIKIEVFENTELVTIPAQYKWVPKPVDYQAPETVTITSQNDSSGGVQCYIRHERPVFFGDKVVGEDRRTKASGHKFMGAPLYKTSCHKTSKRSPVTTTVTLPYDSAFWEDGDRLRIVTQAAKTMVREIPRITKTAKAEPIAVGKVRYPAELTESAPTCLPELGASLDQIDSKIPITSWSVVYMNGYEDNEQPPQDYKLLNPYDLSMAVLSTTFDQRAMDIVWHSFHSGCNPITNKGLNEHGVPRQELYGQQEWMPGELVVKEACTHLLENSQTGHVTESIGGSARVESLFLDKIGPAKTYHVTDMEKGVLIWYDKAGEEIARFQRIP